MTMGQTLPRYFYDKFIFKMFLTHDAFSVDGGCVVVGGGGRVEAVDFAAVQRIVLWGQRQGLTLLERGYK